MALKRKKKPSAMSGRRIDHYALRSVKSMGILLYWSVYPVYAKEDGRGRRGVTVRSFGRRDLEGANRAESDRLRARAQRFADLLTRLTNGRQNTPAFRQRVAANILKQWAKPLRRMRTPKR